MNGVHDMGGMHGMGPIRYENNEPVFHEWWEGRVFALTRALRVWRKWTGDAFRHAVELVPAAEYLRMSYYERFLTGLIALLVKSGLASEHEITTGQPDAGSGRAQPPLTAEQVPGVVARGQPASRDGVVRPRFHVGQQVRARNINPAGHTRLPRYARGKVGTIERDHGVFVFPDSNALFLGEKPQHVYTVRFAACELWGEDRSPRDGVYVNLWDDYLEPA